MDRRLTIAVISCLLASPAAAYDDGHGKEWRQLVETTGLIWNQVAQVCPLDGATACAGTVGGRNLSGWIWGTQLQVIDLFNYFLFENPTLPNDGFLSVQFPGVGGMAYWFTAQTFPFTPTFSFTMNGAPYLSSTSITGWTSTLEAGGSAILGSVGFGNSPVSIDGGFSVGGVANPAVLPVTPTGLWLWRPVGPDYSPPVVTAQLDGQLGNAGWYVSPVSITWNIQDPDSAILSQSGCDPTTVVADTSGESFVCQVTSEGGTASASVSMRVDLTAPMIACGSNVFQLGQPFAQVTATVDDATSGPLVTSVFAYANTATPGARSVTLTGSDRAGNQTSVECPYMVMAPTCQGLAPTLFGTGSANVIDGTSGRDVIHGLYGNDIIYGNGGDDVICGGEGNDEIEGGDGDDDLNGGTGNDSIRGDDGTDNCVSGEVRMSSCATNEPYHGGSACGFGAEIALALGALARARRRLGDAA